jgi:CRISPR-associated protein Cmr5
MSNYHKRHKQTPKQAKGDAPASPLPMPKPETKLMESRKPFQTIGQRNAQAAWCVVDERIQAIDKAVGTVMRNKKGLASAEPHTTYRARTRSLPQMIHQCGLAQTIAFCQSRKTSENDKYQYGAWLDDVATVLDLKSADLCAKSRTDELLAYMKLTHQVLHAASWLKSYAEARMDKSDKVNNDGRGEE